MAVDDSSSFSSATSAMVDIRDMNASTIALATTTLVLAVTLVARKIVGSYTAHGLPPHIPSTIPYLGHAISFGKAPVEFLTAAYEKYGPVFSFTMVGKTFTYLIGSDAASAFFNSKNEQLNAEEVYGKLVTPVFGKGVAYDVPNHIFLEQKKMFKTGLNIARFRQHVPMIAMETMDYFREWGDSGQKDLFTALSQLIILTASRCLHGKEIRSIMNKDIAQLYYDLDGGFTPEAWLLPSWLPLPSFRKRDEAHKKIKQVFYSAIKTRKESGTTEDDMLQTLIDSTYKDGRHLTDDEIAGMLIGLLMAGQHTSSTTSAWLGFFLAKHKDIQQACYDEQVKVFGKDLSVDYDGLKECLLLERCLKESLRLRPPIVTMMRMCKVPLNIMGYTIPPGHQVCVSPTTNQCLADTWDDAKDFIPDRFLDTKGACNDEKFSYVPFGAGRHRCIGESFAYVQIRAIWSLLVRMFEFDLVDGYFPTVNVTTMLHTPYRPIIAFKRRV